MPSLGATTDKTTNETQKILKYLYNACYEAYKNQLKPKQKQ